MTNESYLCINIATNSIRVLEKDAAGKVIRWGILERDGLAFHSSIRPIDPADAAVALRQLLDQMKVSAGLAVFSVPSFYVFTAVSDIVDPKLIPAVPGAYRLEAKQLKDDRYFIIAWPTEIVEKYREICRLAGLRLENLELESSAIAERLEGVSRRTLVVDTDRRLTTFSVVDGGRVEYIFHTDFGDASVAANVIMNKTKEIAGKKSVRDVLFSNSVFNIANGLQKVSQQTSDDYSGRGGVRSAY